MEKAILIFLISCFCCVISEFSGIMQWLQYYFRTVLVTEQEKLPSGEWGPVVEKKIKLARFRPFDCAKCLSFWMCLITFLIMGEGFMSLFYACICMVTSIYIVRYAK